MKTQQEYINVIEGAMGTKVIIMEHIPGLDEYGRVYAKIDDMYVQSTLITSGETAEEAVKVLYATLKERHPALF